MTAPWRPAAATGVGSLPGTVALEAARVVAGELPDLVHVLELPGRGPGADMIGRTGGLLAAVTTELGLETTPDGWRLAAGVGRQVRRATSFLGEDLDALEETTQGYAGPVKCQLAGPWTFAAAVELPSGERILRDPGAVLEVAHALAEAARIHVAEIRRRVPSASAVVVQLDEPGLPAVLAGRIGTASGLSSYRAVDPQVAERVLGVVLGAVSEAGARPAVHCCAADVPVDLLAAAGAQAVSLDVTAMTTDADAAVGRLLEGGRDLLAGAVPSLGEGRLGDTAASAPLRGLLHRLGLEDDRWLAQIAVTPTCGLAGASPMWARTALSASRAVGRVLRHDEQPEVDDGE